MGALSEIFEDQETVCSVAIAGANNAGENAACERRLFEVIQKMTGDIALLNELRADINALAQLAGLQVEVQS